MQIKTNLTIFAHIVSMVSYDLIFDPNLMF